MSEPVPESEFENEEPELDAENGEETSSQESEPPPIPPADPMEALQAEVEKWRDLAARNQADLENFRKRMAREKTDALLYANSNLFQSLLPVIDNFDMGLKAAAGEGEDSMIYQGMVMVQKQLADFLTENNVEPLTTEEGAAFDPNLHEAIKQEPSDSVPEGHIIFEMRRGYKLRERLLRAANVVVSTGPQAETELEA